MSKTILILGASYAGLTVAHSLLKKTLTSVKDYKVVLVSPSTHHYWNLAAVRAIVPGQFGDEKLFQAIAPEFKKYPKESFQFIHGAASALDPTTKTVTISTSAGEEIKQSYDILVLTTGSRYTSDQPWKPSPQGYEATKALLHKTQEKVNTAKSIVVGGGGPTGVETAGELGFEYQATKEITLITGAEELCAGGLPTNIARGAEDQLKKMHVKVLKSVTIAEAKETSEGKTELTLSNGTTMLVDLYLPTVGVVPNSEFIPKHLLNEKGDVVVDPYLRVKNAEDIWAAGDITDLEPSQFVVCEKQAGALAKNLDLVLRGKEAVMYKIGDPVLAVSLGRSKATGRAGNMKIPSLVLWWVKGRTLGTQNLAPYVTGSKF